MRRPRITVAASSLALICALASATQNNCYLFMPGDALEEDYPREDLAKLPKLGWLALVAVKGQWVLKPTRMVFDRPGEKRISSSVPGATAYLRHPALVAGGVVTPNIKFEENVGSFYIGKTTPLNFAFNSRPRLCENALNVAE